MRRPRETVTPDSLCPHCGAHVSRAAPASPAYPDARPQPGDLMVCVYCVGVLRFGPDLRPETVTADDLARLPAAEREALARGREFLRRHVKLRPIEIPARGRA